MRFRERVMSCLGGANPYDPVSTADLSDFVNTWFEDYPDIAVEVIGYLRGRKYTHLRQSAVSSGIHLGIICYGRERGVQWRQRTLQGTFDRAGGRAGDWYDDTLLAWMRYRDVGEGDYKRLRKLLFYYHLAQRTRYDRLINYTVIKTQAVYLLGGPVDTSFYADMKAHGLIRGRYADCQWVDKCAYDHLRRLDISNPKYTFPLLQV